MSPHDRWVEQARRAVRPLETWSDFDPLLQLAANRQIVLIGEMSHGTHESHVLRTQLTMRLIHDLGFTAVFVEADRLDALEFDQVVRVLTFSQDPAKTLAKQTEWPSWMWSNTEVAGFGQWLKNHNWGLPRADRVSWHGLDYWPLWAATREVLDWVKANYGTGAVNTALDAPLLGQPMVATEDIGAVAEYLAHRLAIERSDQAVWYYRRMLTGGSVAMNARAQHWLDMLIARAGDQKVVVWAHNTHIGDSEGIVSPERQVSFGNLVRHHYGCANALLVGFAGGLGNVIAAPRRGAPMGEFPVREPSPESVEAILTAATGAQYALVIPGQSDWSMAVVPQRAIGAVYDGSTDFNIPTQVGTRYDALLWSRETGPVEAMHLAAARAGLIPTLRL